ncbi:MAG: ATP-binding cassette domain-containing protein [Streptosporangiales bacterium]|nr:ATP-binding cassette domain-containing protein [Streptosporangiales bacterium]
MVTQRRPLLEFDHVTLAYGQQEKASQGGHVAIDDVSCSVGSGEKFVIIGPSGCGKSTLLKAAAGFLPPKSGTVTLDGAEVTAPGPDRLVVFQEFDQLLPWRTVRGNLTYALRRTSGRSRADVADRVEEYIAMVGLTDRIDAFPHQLSGGQKQRAAIARSLACDPSILLMDEPFGALDAQTRTRMQQELNNIWRNLGTTILFVTHDIQEAVLLGHRILVLTPGPGRLRALLDNPHEGTDSDDPAVLEFVGRVKALLVDTTDAEDASMAVKGAGG